MDNQKFNAICNANNISFFRAEKNITFFAGELQIQRIGRDFATFSFMQWYVTEQIEEETLARRALELFGIIGELGIGLWTIEELGKLHGKAAASAQAKG